MDFEKVRNIITETLGCDLEKVTMEATLAEDLGAHSLASVELTMALEEAVGLAIEDDALANMKTVGDFSIELSKGPVGAAVSAPDSEQRTAVPPPAAVEPAMEDAAIKAPLVGTFYVASAPDADPLSV